MAFNSPFFLLFFPPIIVYHGEATKLPRRYISRERLCLRGTTDYWVNAMDGAPFFCVTKAVDPGLQKTLEEEIVPRLLEEIPGQPTREELAAEPLRHRFTLIFDREGYSPALFSRLKTRRIAILTYHKHPGEDWAQEEFAEQTLTHPNGETSRVKLARETLRRHDDARSFVRGLFSTSVNLRPDPAGGELRVEIHGQTNPIHDQTVQAICDELNTTETLYPGTDLRLVYRPIRSPLFPGGQDV